MTNPHAARLDRAREQLSERGVDALLLGPSADLVYLTGYDAPLLERLTMLVLPAKGEPRLVVPRLEAPLASGHLGDLEVEVAAWDETEDPVVLVRAALGDGAADGRLAVGDRLWSTFLLRLQAALPGADFTVASSVTRALRMVKDAAEIEALAAAAAAIDQVVDGLAELGWAGRSEREVAREIDEAIRATGHDETCFVIVGSGPNGASPHHSAGPRVIQPGDAVVVDIGGRPARLRRAVPGAPGRPGGRLPGGRPRRARRGGRRRLPRADRRGGLRRELRPPHRPRHRARGARGPLHRRRQRRAARRRHGVLGGARHLPRRPLRRPHRGHRGLHRRRRPAPQHDPTGPAGGGQLVPLELALARPRRSRRR